MTAVACSDLSQRENREKWIKINPAREELMMEQMDHVISNLDPNEKIILMGRAMHLSKDPGAAFFGSKPDSARVMWPSIGEYLNKQFTGQVLSFWMLYNRGSQSYNSCPDIDCPTPDSESNFGRTLSKIGNLFLLPTSSKNPASLYFDRLFSYPTNNNTMHTSNLMRNTDIIFFFNHVHGLRERN